MKIKKNGKVIRLTESDLQKIVKRVIREERISEMGGMDDTHPRFGNVNFSELSKDGIINLGRDDFQYEEETIDDISDDDEYYGTFDDYDRVDRSNRRNFDDYGEFEEEEFEDFDSYRKSRYGSDSKNRWEFNSPNEEMGRKYFKAYQEKHGGKPFRVRRRK